MYRIVKGKVNIRKASLYSLSALLVVATVLVGVLPGQAHAASLSQVMVRFDRLQISQQTTGTVCAKTTNAGVEASVQVAFPTGYTLGAFGLFTVNTTNTNSNWPTGGTPWPGIATATAVATQTVTFPSTDLSINTLYCFNWANAAAVTTTSSASSTNAGTVTTRNSVPAALDTGSYVTDSLTSDSIAVSASVPQTFTYGINNTADALGSLTAGSVNVSPTPRVLTINTNAGGGWMVWGQDAFTGLKSTATGTTIASTTPGTNSTISGTTEGYNMGVTSTQTSGSGAISVAAPFIGGTSGKGGGLDTSMRTVASSNGTANNAQLTLTNNVTLSSLTPAATDYADTITLPAAAMF
jgi:hypothetical protein